MAFFVDVSVRSLNKHNEELCGDKVEVIRTRESVIIILSDGLGSGVKANILATLTSKIIGTMLKEGASIDEAVDTITQTLPICSVRQVAYSTFTILQIFNDGHAYIVEFDNPSIAFFRAREAVCLPWKERIVHGKRIRESELQIFKEDIFVMFSDGVVHAGVGKILNMGWQYDNVLEYIQKNVRKNPSVNMLAGQIISACSSFYQGEPGDDTTIVAAEIRQPSHLSIMAGPPSDPSMDAAAVKSFMDCPGAKIVCGGTTANIVSRCIKKPIKTILEYESPDIPPIAYIAGIDLVTEGIITLNKVLKNLKDINKGAMEQYNLIYRYNDGASKLTRMLLDRCTHINLYIGRAVNPAHKKQEFSDALGIKTEILELLAEKLDLFGKEVVKIYY
ncbi:SpoIIE family protein phosphatase [Lutispora saccharofermentans]|uniref:Serine/threonine-protein phosphatase n=1 Tax=Lutispora saccharofermentans TaxID=3024236 RepID=A0ABT1NHY4_9FIRM|nr:SpoIIE family protein phosphatase [Lutispora saccharofermentans]MCQ1530860.1 serine/threonine-protein phosphatase [Lutispora saccharofermentans]